MLFMLCHVVDDHTFTLQAASNLFHWLWCANTAACHRHRCLKQKGGMLSFVKGAVCKRVPALVYVCVFVFVSVPGSVSL